MFATTLRLDRAQAEELNRRISEVVDEFNRLNRDEDGNAVAGDPDSDGSAHDFRVMYAFVADPYDRNPGSAS